MIKILLVEDHKVVREGIKLLLAKEKDFKIIAEANNGAEASELIEDGLNPNIVLTDINMPVMNGLELIKHLRTKSPSQKIIVLSMMDCEHYIIDAFNFGAHGYTLKNADYTELVLAIRHVMQGKLYISSELGLKMFAKVRSQTKAETFKLKPVHLSEKELEVLALTADGLTNQQIADKLFMGKRTVEGHRLNLIEKTGVRNAAALIQYAFRAGIIH